jgi:hypothetical protein
MQKTCFRAARRITLLLALVLVTAPVAESDNSGASKLAVPPMQARELLALFDGVLARPATLLQWNAQVRVERFRQLFSEALGLAHAQERRLIPLLIAGLTTPERSVSFHAAYILRYVTGLRQGFRVIEIDIDKQVVRERRGLGYPAKAYRQ